MAALSPFTIACPGADCDFTIDVPLQLVPAGASEFHVGRVAAELSIARPDLEPIVAHARQAHPELFA
jgi:hypothetical protein